jgi:hypothetical protein
LVRLFRLREFAGEDVGAATLALLDERGGWPLCALAQDFQSDENTRAANFYCFWNEVPILLLIIVATARAKPFSAGRV